MRIAVGTVLVNQSRLTPTLRWIGAVAQRLSPMLHTAWYCRALVGCPFCCPGCAQVKHCSCSGFAYYCACSQQSTLHTTLHATLHTTLHTTTGFAYYWLCILLLAFPHYYWLCILLCILLASLWSKGFSCKAARNSLSHGVVNVGARSYFGFSLKDLGLAWHSGWQHSGSTVARCHPGLSQRPRPM